MPRLVTFCLCLLIAGSVPAQAQNLLQNFFQNLFQSSPQAPAQAPRQSASRPAAPRPQTQPSQPVPPDQPAPYEPQMLRLAELLGLLSYLRELCGAGDADQWRAQMVALLEEEGANSRRKERLAGAFNQGFQGYEMSYRSCTSNARLVMARAIHEGERLTRDLANRYGED